MKYKAILGDQHIIMDFIEEVQFRLNHEIILPATVTKLDRNTVMIETPLVYPVGQPVSIGGYEIDKKNFRLLEVSITDYPVLENAYISEIIEGE